MKNADDFYKKYQNAYKNDYGNDDELKEKKLTINSLNCLIK